MKEIKVTQPFEPVYNLESTILILGSFPSVMSRKNQFYYTNPQNRFWKVLGTLFQEDFYSMNNKQKKETLLHHHVALYDVVYSCTIQGSSDSKIKNVVVANIEQIINQSRITKIYLNGTTAYQLFIKNFKNLAQMAILLPSTSSANAHFSLEKLLQAWSVIKK